MLDLEMRRAFEGHGAADIDIGGLDLGAGKAEKGQEIEIRILQLFRRNLQDAGEEFGAERPSVEDEFDVEGGAEQSLDLVEFRLREALRLQARGIDRRGLLQRAMPDRIGHDLVDLGCR